MVRDLTCCRGETTEANDFFIEAKFYAPLTRNQPVRYLERLTTKGVSVLMFLAPAERVDVLWPELLGRLADRDKPDSDEESRCIAIEGTGKHLLITDWTKLLDNMEERLKDSKSGLAELGQLRGLVQFAKSGVGKASLSWKGTGQPGHRDRENVKVARHAWAEMLKLVRTAMGDTRISVASLQALRVAGGQLGFVRGVRVHAAVGALRQLERRRQPALE